MRVAAGWIGAIAVGAVGWALGAGAAPLHYSATLEIDFGALPMLSTAAMGTLDVASDGSFALPAGVLDLVQVANPPQTPSQAFTKLSFDLHNGTGMFGGPAQAGGPMPLLGKVKLFATAALGFPPATLPISQGFSGGMANAVVSNGTTMATLSLLGTGTGRWRTGQVKQHSSTPFSVFGTRTNTGTDGRTPMGIGSMNLVIPVAFRRSLDGAFQEQDAVTGFLSITMPEPGRLGLEAASIAALLLAGAGRVRARR